MNEEKPVPLEIPLERLSPEILTAVIENFILREGTDYGMHEVSHETKVAQVRKQLERGDIKIAFDAENESVTLLTKRDWLQLLKKPSA